MLAIAGAKGGCGKTTTALGLADAFARAESPSIVVDADRQLPDLHATAGVDREPTLAELDGGPDPEAVAQELPEAPGVGVVPGPKPSEQLDLEAALERLHTVPEQVVIDCPSGAGPDVVEPLTASDRIVVVTTPHQQSVTAAATTVDVARRLNVPVEGAVVTQSAEVPPDVESRLDVPVLGAIPEADAPLDDEAARAAFDEVAQALVRDRAPDEPEGTALEGSPRLSTGIEPLDRELGGGFAPGSVVALVGGPASQAEQLLYRLTGVRGTLYLSTQRSEPAIRDAVDASVVPAGSPTVRHLDGEDPLDAAREFVEQLPDGSNLVVDPADALERTDRRAYVDFLNDLKEQMVESDSVAVLHCLRRPTPPENRAATAHAADAVVEFEADGGRGTADHALSIAKRRGGTAPSKPVPIDVADLATRRE